MTCTRIGKTIVCTQRWARLKLGNRYVWLDFHPWFGPSFYWNGAMSKLYDPVDEHDPIWDVFWVWLDKFNALEAKRLRPA